MEFDLKKHTILAVVCGSQAYGTATATSDVDIKGIACPPKDYYFSLLKNFEQADKPVWMEPFVDNLPPNLKEIASRTKLEGSIYEITKYFKMLLEVNPNSLDTLFCDDSDVILVTPAGQKIRDNRDLFLSKKVRYTFFSYAFSQMQRIMTHRNWLLLKAEKEPQREDFGLKPKTEIPKNQMDAVSAYVKKQMDHWETDITSEEELSEPTKIKIREKVAFLLKELKISSENRFVAACNLIGFEENFILYLQKEREYEKALREHKQYLEWKRSRNEDRAGLEQKYGYDVKHGSHIYRLCLMCEELLMTGKLIVKRPDREQILAIRNGEWPYEKLVEWFEQKKQSIDELFKTSTTLPDAPNRKKIDALLLEIMEDCFREQSNTTILKPVNGIW